MTQRNGMNSANNTQVFEMLVFLFHCLEAYFKRFRHHFYGVKLFECCVVVFLYAIYYCIKIRIVGYFCHIYDWCTWKVLLHLLFTQVLNSISHHSNAAPMMSLRSQFLSQSETFRQHSTNVARIITQIVTSLSIWCDYSCKPICMLIE